MRRLFAIFQLTLLASCAAGPRGPRFSEMTAAQHREAARRENREADEEYAKATKEMGPSDEVVVSENSGGGDDWGFFQRSWNPDYPEYYTVDPRPRVAGEAQADSAREHRERAERHERAAEELERRYQ